MLCYIIEHSSYLQQNFIFIHLYINPHSTGQCWFTDIGFLKPVIKFFISPQNLTGGGGGGGIDVIRSSAGISRALIYRAAQRAYRALIDV